ncbi:MAG: hypothetical protein K0Q92_609 [Steroidobacteraceae bacterium]|jgi:hypothetical protein|nr:hypothetical protein [Steroidobacteraceae bacterium]
MAKASPITTSLNAGELSPMIDGRVDFNKYASGASLMENFIPTVQGPIVRRGGTRFVAEAKDGTDRVFLHRFEFSVTQTYMLEFGPGYIRFFANVPSTGVFPERGLVEVAGVPVEVVTPYTSDDIYNDDDTCGLRFAQSADVLYITSPNHPPYELRRTSPTSFSFVPFVNRGGPWESLNDTATTVYASAETGAVTLTASAGIFSANDVGTQIYLESQLVDSVAAWEVAKTVAIGDRRRSDGKNYVATTAGVTGTNRPVHTEGTLYDGDAVAWQYTDPGYGYVQITGYTSPTVVTGTVVDRLPAQVVSAGNASTRWAFSAWRTTAAGTKTYPSCVAFHRERIWFARGQNVWSSVSAEFNNFSPKNFGQVTDDMAINLTIQSGTINDVQWLMPGKELLIGTAGGEFTLGELQNGDPLGPGNVRVRLQSQYGSRAITPITLGDSTLFIQRAGLKAREIFYDFGSDGYKSTDTTVLAEHVTKTGIIDIDLAQEPDPIVWCLRADGRIVGFTWNNEQEVRAWHRHPIGGDYFSGGASAPARVKSIATMPSIDGARNELWLCVRRNVSGTFKQFIEVMEQPHPNGAWDSFTDPIGRRPEYSQFYVDGGSSVSSALGFTTVSGLDHLNGATVQILADGAPHPDRVVSGGSITLQAEHYVAHIGFAAPCKWRSMRIEAGAQDGTAQGKTKRLHKVVLRFIETGGGKFGADEQNLDYVQFRDSSAPMGQATPLYSGDMPLQWPNGYDTDGYVMYVNDQPTKSVIAAVMPQVMTQDSR